MQTAVGTYVPHSVATLTDRTRHMSQLFDPMELIYRTEFGNIIRHSLNLYLKPKLCTLIMWPGWEKLDLTYIFVMFAKFRVHIHHRQEIIILLFDSFGRVTFRTESRTKYVWQGVLSSLSSIAIEICEIQLNLYESRERTVLQLVSNSRQCHM